MNRKHIKFLYENVDYTTLADIANKEKENENHNIYYDLITKEAIVYPNDNGEKRPLRTRLLKNGVRLNMELSRWLADSIEYAIKTKQEDIMIDILNRNGYEVNKKDDK